MDLREIASVRGTNFFDADKELQAHLSDNLEGFENRWKSTLSAFGAFVANDVDQQAEYSDRHFRPKLEHYQEDGRYHSRVIYNRYWTDVSRDVYRHGIVGLNYTEPPAPYTVTFAMAYLLGQADISLHCPVGMTAAVTYVIDRFAPAPLRARYLGQLASMRGDAFTAGTWVTERHGGCDVGATTTQARAEGDHFTLDGLKWFVSNASSELAIATARPSGAAGGSKGLGLYVVPARWTDGSLNSIHVRKLKDKLGTCGIATGEVELVGAKAFELAPPPLGFKIMMEALDFSRIQNALGSMGIQRRAFMEAAQYCYKREAFGRRITEYPMVREQLTDMVVRVEASLALGFEVMRAFEAVKHETSESPGRAWLRLITALAKYQTAEHANVVCRRALETMGGNAYTYDYCLPRLVRDAQVLTIWEGPANIQALEMLRMLTRLGGLAPIEDRAHRLLEHVPAELSSACARLVHHLNRARSATRLALSELAESERHARNLMDFLADITSALFLLEAAARELGRGNARKAVVARLFVEGQLDRNRDRDFKPGRSLHERTFDALMNSQKVPIAELAPGSPAQTL
jgi:alkylation response protein AidB-like acyl-CoA dehydrogenase